MKIEFPNIEMPDFGQVKLIFCLNFFNLKFQVKDGYSIADGLKAADNSIGVISEAVATPTKESLK